MKNWNELNKLIIKRKNNQVKTTKNNKKIKNE